MYNYKQRINTMSTTSTKPQSFKTQHSEEKRKAEADRIKLKYPDRIPVIVEKAPKCTLPDIDKQKYLVPSLSWGQFTYVIRKRIKLAQDEALFVYVNNTLPPAAALMDQVYKEHADPDGFLYLQYMNEASFGTKTA